MPIAAIAAESAVAACAAIRAPVATPLAPDAATTTNAAFIAPDASCTPLATASPGSASIAPILTAAATSDTSPRRGSYLFATGPTVADK